jgi:hypothetical protein
MLNATDNEDGTGVRELFYTVNGTPLHALGSAVSIPVTTEGQTTITFFAKDKAGNSEATQSLTIKLDKTAPIFSNLSRTPPNANGWNNTDVDSSFTATDSLSGFASGATESGTFAFTQEGASLVHTFTVSDLAGNSASADISNVNIDKTLPIISAVADPAPNANGWNNTNVTVSFNASDALSGIDTLSGPVTLTNEGAGQVVNGTATDRAGNTASVSRSINIDKTVPEAFIQFDPVTKNVLVFGRDMFSGVSGGAIPPLAVTPPSGHGEHGDDDDDDGAMEQRTYLILDSAGNSLTLVLKVKAEGHELKAEILSLQYNSGLVTSAPKNKLAYEWATASNGNLKQLEQKLNNAEQQVEAEFKADRNQTVIKTKQPNGTIIKPGLVLLRLASAGGQLVIEY